MGSPPIWQKPPANTLASQRHSTGSTSVDAHLLFNAGANNVVRFTQTAVIIYPDFRNDKKRNSFGPLRRALDPGQYRMNKILRKIVVAGGNENFIPGN